MALVVAVAADVLMYAAEATDGTPHLLAIAKATGKQTGMVEVPDKSSYGMMTYAHDGRQYLVLQSGSQLTTLALPD